jgi:hypothetical protein
LRMVEQRGDGPSNVEVYQLSSALAPRCGNKRERKRRFALRELLMISSLTLM